MKPPRRCVWYTADRITAEQPFNSDEAGGHQTELHSMIKHTFLTRNNTERQSMVIFQIENRT